MSFLKDLQKSGWKVYIGYAAEDKPYDVNMLKVSIPELMPFDNGKMESGEAQAPYTLTNEDGTTETGQITITNTFNCTYFGMTHEVIPPDVVTGEQVMIFHKSSSDTYYWVSMGRDDKLRHREKITNYAANSGRGEALNRENSYGSHSSTRSGDKYAEFFTTDSDGEEYAYRVKLDALNSILYIDDNGQNSIKLESKIPRIHLENRDGTQVSLDKQDIYLVAPRQVHIATPVMTTDVMQGDQTFVLNGKGCTMNMSNTFGVNAPCGAFKVEQLIVEGEIQAKNVISEGGFSTGSCGSFELASSDTEGGTGNAPDNKPMQSGDSDNRHCCAYEQIMMAFTDVKEALTNLGEGGKGSDAVSHAAASLMQKNRGE